MKRVKKPKQKTVTLTEKKILQIKREACDEAVRKACLLFLVGVADELKVSGKELENIMMRVERYAKHVDDHLVRMKEVSDMLYKSTGIELRW